MPRSWESLAEASDGMYEVNDFKQALYQLVTQQCLYSRFHGQAVAYRLISRYRNDFKEAADLMGLKLSFADSGSFCFVVQEVARPQSMDSKEIRFLLTLRRVYHVRATAGDLTPEGDAVVGLAELQESYKQLTGRDLDTKAGAIEPLLKLARRQGLARTGDAEDDGQPYTVVILPGIAEILSEHTVNRFGAALKASLPDDDASSKVEAEVGGE